MRLPTESEINVHNSPDEIAACRNFLGKTLAEAEAMFREGGARYQEDLMWMGPAAFNFYLQAVISYLESDSSRGDDHFIDCLDRILTFRSDEPDFSSASANVTRLVEYVFSNYEKFNVDPGIYGDLKEKYRQRRVSLLDSSGRITRRS